MRLFGRLSIALFSAGLAGYAAPGWAQDAPAAQPWAAQIKVSRGIVRIERAGKRYPGPVGARLKVDDAIVTGANGSVGLIFLDNSALSMGPDTEVALQRYNYDPTTYMGAFDAYVKQGTVTLQPGNLAAGGSDNVRLTTPKSELTGNARRLLISVEGNQ